MLNISPFFSCPFPPSILVKFATILCLLLFLNTIYLFFLSPPLFYPFLPSFFVFPLSFIFHFFFQNPFFPPPFVSLPIFLFIFVSPFFYISFFLSFSLFKCYSVPLIVIYMYYYIYIYIVFPPYFC